MAKGDCYEAAFKYIMEKSLFGPENRLVLVHGTPLGQGPIEGLRFGHAWVEDGNTVIDRSNGGNTHMPKRDYYELGNIDPKDSYRYSWSEAREMASKFKHYGPWESNSPR